MCVWGNLLFHKNGYGKGMLSLWKSRRKVYLVRPTQETTLRSITIPIYNIYSGIERQASDPSKKKVS